MWCFISEPNGIIHEIVLPKSSLGQECFDKVCEKLKLVEKDYFGLKYVGPKGVQLWLNMRNSMSSQLSGKPPHRLYMLVKFFVKPQELQQEISRHEYYLTLKRYIAEGKLDLSMLQTRTIARICALIAQVETGDFSQDGVSKYSTYVPLSLCRLYARTSDLHKDATSEHLKLGKTNCSEAKIELLHLLSNVPGYGVEVFRGKVREDKELKRLEIAVGNDGLRVLRVQREYDLKQAREVTRKSLEKRISFEDVSTVSYNNKSFTVVYGGSGSQAQRITYKLKNEHDAVALFRTFTEYHTFYQCNTVKRSVIDQCTRTFLGRVVSLLFPSSDLGQLFLFDVQRTRRQAYSQAWNELNSRRHDNIPIYYDGSSSRSGYSTISEYRPVQSPLSQRKSHNIRRKEDICKSGNRKGLSERENVENLSMPQLKKIVRHLQDARICQICMDMEVATAFCPCGHVVCCVDCSVMCKECPLCRSQITYAQRVFFPFE